MLFAKNPKTIGLVVALMAAVSALPLLSQEAPESILPPGFGDPVEDNKPPPKQNDDGPVDLLPNVQPRPVSSSGPKSSGTTASVNPSLDGLPPVDPAKTDDEEDPLAPATLQDLPDHARRPISLVGVLGEGDGDMGIGAFGASRGPYLAHLMRVTDAPIASRWASITLRRALLSHVATPAGINGADFAAERAWLLVRMGEADAGRMMVQAVDADQYTPWMKSVAMQSALASADPAGLCPAAEGHPAAGKDPYWKMSRAICSAFSGETSLASALVDQVQDARKTPAIDALLTEKVVGAASNSRRSINILWENVSELTAWRFGLATSTALAIPEPLMKTVGPRVRAWRARAPLLDAAARTGDMQVGAALGVFSSAALVDHYSMLVDDGDGNSNGEAMSLGKAYAEATPTARIAAMKALWAANATDPLTKYAHSILTARAAANIPAADALSADADSLIASMLSAGLDVQAARWSNIVGSGSLGWALLAVGSPQKPQSISNGDVTGFEAGESGKRAQFLLAGLAGLGRLSDEAANSVAEDLGVAIGRQNAWTKAIDRAADAREPATVALLAAVGLQGSNWSKVSPSQLFHAVSALRRVGLDGEARMIAAEALMRG
jgi:hypothetical protein